MSLRSAVRWVCLAALAATSTISRAQDDETARGFRDSHGSHAGLYRTGDEFIIIGLIPSAEIVYFEHMSTGAMRFLARDGGSFRYSPTRNLTAQTAGSVQFVSSGDGLIWTDGAGKEHHAKRVSTRTIEVRIANGKDVSLAGTLVLPPGDGPHAAVVLIPQSGRFDIWDVGMWLHSRGIAVLAYDQRNSGDSSGPDVSGPYQDRQSVYATDAAAVVRFVRSRPEIDADRVGVAGWSGGGFIGAFVAAGDPDLAFYVNIAGDASPGFEQASHMFVARLMREGFGDEDVDAARRFVGTHFSVAEGHVSWDDYQRDISRVSDTDWYAFLSNRYSIPHVRAEGVADIGAYQSQWPPERVYGRITSTPTLGVFFEYDHSSSPSSPLHFLRALQEAANGNHTVVIIPDANHGGFLLDGQGYRFNTSTLTGRSPIVIDTVADWVERQIAAQ